MTLRIPNDEVEVAFPEFEFIRPLKSGGQKQVYEVIWGGKTWALKVMPIEMDEDETPRQDTIERARREVSIMQTCDTPYLVKMGPLGLDQRQVGSTLVYFYLEEFIPGKDVQTMIQAGRLKERELLALARDVGSAISVLWNNGWVHRDIKPANIMWDQSRNHFVVLDVGLSLDLFDTSLTGTGYVVGTRRYLSPEQVQLNKRDLDFRSDLFALGYVLYEGATQRHPFLNEHQHTSDCVANLLMSEATPISTYSPDISREFQHFIMRLLDKRPHMRFRSCDSFLKAIADLSSHAEERE